MTNTADNLTDDTVKIVAYCGDRSACAFYRINSPLHALTDSNKSPDFKYISKGVMEKIDLDPGRFDVAIFQRQYKPEVFNYMMQMKKHGTKVIYEIDDNLFEVPPWNPAHKFFEQRSVREYIQIFLENVDAVFVTQEYLKKVYAKYNPNVFVLPNSIDFKVMHGRPRNNRHPVVCWQGSNTHEKDLALVRKAFLKLVKDDDCFVKLWSMDVPGAHKVPLVQFEAFFPMYGQLDIDIGLAPLAPNNFNRCKSNLKFLEYSALRTPTIASDFGPYKDVIKNNETGLLVGNVKDWYGAIRMLIDDVAERERLGNAAYEFVKENYDIDKNCVYWGQAIKQVLGRGDKDGGQ